MKTINLKSTATFSQVRYEEQNPSFATAVMKVMAVGKLANKTIFTKEAILNALSTLKNTPLVSLYKVGQDDLGGHETSYIIKNGKMKLTYGTDAIGVIPESANQWFETFEEDGQQVEYLMSDVLIWRRYDASELILKEGQFPVSMEIEIKEQFEDSNGISLVTDFDFLAVAVLGSRKMPAFRSTYLKVFEEESETFAELQRDLTRYLTFEAKGGDTMDETLIETLNEPLEEQPEKPEETTEATFEGASTTEENPSSDEANSTDDKEENQVDEKEGDAEKADEPTDSTPDEKDEKDEKTFESDEETNSTEDAPTLQAQYEALLVAHGQLQAQYETTTQSLASLNEELETLRQFKACIDQKEREKAETALFARFPQLIGLEELTALQKNAGQYELDQLEQQLFMLLGKQAYEAQQGETTPHVVVYERQPQKENVPCAFNILDKYL